MLFTNVKFAVGTAVSCRTLTAVLVDPINTPAYITWNARTFVLGREQLDHSHIEMCELGQIINFVVFSPH